MEHVLHGALCMRERRARGLLRADILRADWAGWPGPIPVPMSLRSLSFLRLMRRSAFWALTKPRARCFFRARVLAKTRTLRIARPRPLTKTGTMRLIGVWVLSKCRLRQARRTRASRRPRFRKRPSVLAGIARGFVSASFVSASGAHRMDMHPRPAPETHPMSDPADPASKPPPRGYSVRESEKTSV